MKVIRTLTNEMRLDINKWLTKKGYRLNQEYALLENSIQIGHIWSQMWQLHTKQDNFIIVKQKQAPYTVFIIDIGHSIVTAESVRFFIEMGQEPDTSSFRYFT